MKLTVLTFFLTLLFSTKIYCQIDLARHHNPNIPMLLLDDHMKVDFVWNMKGLLQAFINEGINSLDEGHINVALLNLNKAIKLDSNLWMSYYYRAICYKKMRMFKESEQDFLKTIKMNPALAEPHIELAENYIALRNLKKASSLLEVAIQKNPALPQNYYNQAAIALIEGNVIKAKRLYKKANEVGPKYPDAYLMQGLLTSYKQDSKEGLELIGKAIEADPSYSTGYFWRGLFLLQENKIEECLKDWNNLVQYNPENPTYAAMRGYLYIELKQFDKAFIDFKNALRAEEVDENKFGGKQSILDKRIDLHAAAKYLIANGHGLNETAFEFLKKGFCLLLIKDLTGALESLTHAENIQPSATVYFLKAITFEHLEKHNEAMEYYTRALKRDNDIFDAHKKRSVYRLELKDWTGAQEDLDNLFRIAPNSPIAFRLSGLVKAHKNDYEGAIKDLSKFIETDSTDFEIYQTRATCNTLLGNREEAHKDITFLLKKDSTSWTLRNQMVTNYLVLKDTTEALTIIQHYIQIKPDLFLPYKKMAEIYIQQKNLKQTEIMIKKAKSMISELYHPLQYADFYLWEGLIAYYTNDFKTAISKFSKSLKLDFKNWEAYYQRAKAYESSGQLKKALEDYKIVAERDFKDANERYQLLLKK